VNFSFKLLIYFR